jgi:hypothetical protein
VGLVRIAFPESKQFRDRKAAGHKSVTAGVFWGEVRVMLAKEWRLCIYTIILMTVCETKANAAVLARMRTDHFVT